MARIVYSKWWDDIGEDPVDRSTSNRPVETPGTVVSQQLTASSIDQQAPKSAVSQESGFAPFNTLWHNFELEALPFYNFWEPEEESSGKDRGNLDITELPRFIKITWNAAPDLKDPDAALKRAMFNVYPDARMNFTQLSPFGFGAVSITGTTIQGLSFTPPHLQPSHFEENVSKVANGFVSPGVISAVASVETGSLVPLPAPDSALIDEDQYLAQYQTWWGIPFAEFNAALWRRWSSTYGAQQQLLGKPISEPAESDRENFTLGQFGVRAYDPRSQASSITPAGRSSVGQYGTTAASDRNYPQSRVVELAGEKFEPGNERWDREHSVNVNLLDMNIDGALRQERLDAASQPHHLESIIALAQHAGDLAAYSAAGLQHSHPQISIPFDRAPVNVKSLEYIGYVLEKWEMNDGVYALVDTFYIPGREYTEYYDAEVKYGSSYRYRIRAILRWCRPHGVGVLGPDPNVISAPGAEIDSLTPNDVSYFHSEWSHEWAQTLLIDRTPPNPPDELVVRPCSEVIVDKDTKKVGPFVEITFKLPYNPQRDINKMVLFRKIQDVQGKDLTGWVQLSEFIEDLNDPSRQGTYGREMASFAHEQDDITGTKFTRNDIITSGSLVEYGPSNARFEDHDVEYWGGNSNYRYVYAAMCLSRHGEQSVLSDQIGCRLNPEWRTKGELPLDFVSCAGVDIDFDTGLFGTYPERRLRSEFIFKPDVHQNRPGVITVSPQERLAKRALDGSHYALRLESLDTGEHVDIPLTLTINNLPAQQQILPYRPLVAQKG